MGLCRGKWFAEKTDSQLKSNPSSPPSLSIAKMFPIESVCCIFAGYAAAVSGQIVYDKGEGKRTLPEGPLAWPLRVPNSRQSSMMRLMLVFVAKVCKLKYRKGIMSSWPQSRRSWR